MFTGIVEELGEVVEIVDQGDAVRLRVRGPLVCQDARHGDSIAVEGVCLTVADPPRSDDGPPQVGTFVADVMKETLDRTSLGALTAGSPVNLERAMRADGRFGGHVVQGHVDGTGTIRDRVPGEHWEVVRIDLPARLARYVVEKGSITVDGTSLTVVEVVDGAQPAFTVSLIPTTLDATTLGRKAVGDHVNLEVDVLAKYVERLLTAGGPTGGGAP